MVVEAIDFGFFFSRVIAHYSITPAALLEVPLETFWMLSRNIDRLRAETDIRRLHVARIAQADTDNYRAFEDGLQRRLGKPVITRITYDPTQAKADPDAERKLSRIFG